MRQTLRNTFTQFVAGLCLISLLSPPAWAWGREGHQIVARVAQRRLSSHAQQEVRRLLRPGETLASVATWADDIRQARPETKNWHFVDIPRRAASYDPARDCPRTPFGDCIIQALASEQAILGNADMLAALKKVLADAQASRQARAEALKFLVHLMGDLHQPLHCADDNDRGGNDVRVTFFGRSSNLHKVWDSDLIAQAGGLNTTLNRVEALARTSDLTALRNGTFTDWSLEAHRLANEHSYADIPANKRLAQQYFQTNRPIVDQQLLRAGVRLAALLNELFP